MISEIILHYKIIEKLCEAGMRVLYKAQDTKLERFVGMKILPSQSNSEEEKERFIREVKTDVLLNHLDINVVTDWKKVLVKN